MADWVVCPGCQLRHSRRAGGLCPRCKQAVDGGAVPEPAAAPPPPPGAPPLATSPPPLATSAPRYATSPPPFATSPPPMPWLAPARSLAGAPSTAGLGRLAQSARGKQLKNARVIMLVVGVLSVAVNGYFFSSAESNVQAEIDKEIRKLPPGFVADPVKVAVIKGQAVRATRLISAGGLLLGLLFLGCAVLVERHPVPMTITSLALYLGGNAIFGFIDPSTLVSGILIKVLIVVGLFKAVQAAIAYQKELAAVPGT